MSKGDRTLLMLLILILVIALAGCGAGGYQKKGKRMWPPNSTTDLVVTYDDDKDGVPDRYCILGDNTYCPPPSVALGYRPLGQGEYEKAKAR